MARPTSLPTWATGAGTRVTPPGGTISAGFVAGKKLPAEFLNSLLGLTGDWLTWLAALAFDKPIISSGDQAVGDGSPVLDTTVAPVTYKLLWRVNLGASMYLRIYARKAVAASAVGGLTVTINAAWNSGTSQWDKDVGSERARRFDLGGLGVTALDELLGIWVSSTAPGSFGDSADGWGAGRRLSYFGKVIQFWQTATGATDGNPPATTAMLNTLCPKNVCKAWARVNLTAGTPSILGGFNVASVALAGGNLAVQVNFAQGMADANFAAVATGQVDPVGILAQGTGSVQIFLWDPAAMGAGPRDLSAYTGKFDVVVFGQQDS